MKNRILSFGEILQRLSPADSENIETAHIFESNFGGSEANTLITLSSLGNECSFITVLPDNELGKAAATHLIANDIDLSFAKISGDILGIYYFERGFGSLSSNVIYNRSASEIAKISPDSFQMDYNEVFSNCSLFHISGISFALSEGCRNLCFQLIKEAKSRGIPVSFDFNYRSKLWSVETAKPVYEEIIKYVDILFCSTLDLETFLSVNTDNFYDKYDCEYLVVRDREIVNETTHKVKALMIHKTPKLTEHCSIPEKEFKVLDRVGSGDAFNAGVLHLLLKNLHIKEVLDFGIAVFIAKHSVKGDVLSFSEKNF